MKSSRHAFTPFRLKISGPWVIKQEAQLSQRDRATLDVIEYFAKSPKVTQDHSQ